VTVDQERPDEGDATIQLQQNVRVSKVDVANSPTVNASPIESTGIFDHHITGDCWWEYRPGM